MDQALAEISFIGEHLPFLIALIFSGMMAGFAAGLFGVGGGAIIVPVLYQMLGILGVDPAITMHIAVGTSLAIIVPTSLRSYFKHMDSGKVDKELLHSFVYSVPVGVLCAAIVAAYISGAGLRLIFATLSFVIAAKLLFGRESWKIGGELPGNRVRLVAGWMIGFFSTFMGIGGGVFNNTFMTLYGRSIHQSVATSSGVGVLIAIPGLLGYLWAGWGISGAPPMSFGFVNLAIFLIMTPISILAVPIGVRVAHKMSKRPLEILFGIFLLLVSLRFFASFW